MRLSILACCLIAALQTAASAATREDTIQTYVVNTVRSHVDFSVTHVYVEHVNGSVPIIAATVLLPPGSLVPTSILATLDPKHIETHDPDRNGVLQGPEWFDTKRFPIWNFTSTKITAKADGSGFIVEGTLTIHGATQPATLDATTIPGRNPRVHAVGHVDRHAFGMRVTPMDGTIGGDVEFSMDIELRAK
jgi:polyisoprenoid-binding protein YceI